MFFIAILESAVNSNVLFISIDIIIISKLIAKINLNEFGLNTK